MKPSKILASGRSVIQTVRLQYLSGLSVLHAICSTVYMHPVLDDQVLETWAGKLFPFLENSASLVLLVCSRITRYIMVSSLVPLLMWL